MVGGSIVVLFKWCSIVIALYIMRTFSPNSGSVFCGFLVFFVFILLCCFFVHNANIFAEFWVSVLWLASLSCVKLLCLLFAIKEIILFLSKLFVCLLFVFDKLSLIWCSCHFGVCPVVFIICLSCRCEDLSVLWWTCGKMSIMWWTWSCPTNTVVPD